MPGEQLESIIAQRERLRSNPAYWQFCWRLEELVVQAVHLNAPLAFLRQQKREMDEFAREHGIHPIQLEFERDAELKAKHAAEREAYRQAVREEKAAEAEAKQRARLEKRKVKAAQKELDRQVRLVQRQMTPGTRAHAKFDKRCTNRAKHLRRQLPKMVRHARKCDRPRCDFPCGHPLRPKPCQAPVVAGRHPFTGAPILGKHCRKHGGWS